MAFAPEVKFWTKLWSMRFAIATTIFSSAIGAYTFLPDSLKNAAPTWLLHVLIFGDVGTSIGVGVARVWNQPSLAQFRTPIDGPKTP
jgi:hypothetical protein